MDRATLSFLKPFLKLCYVQIILVYFFLGSSESNMRLFMYRCSLIPYVYVHMYVHTLLYNTCSATPFRVHGHCHIYRTCGFGRSVRHTSSVYVALSVYSKGCGTACIVQ